MEKGDFQTDNYLNTSKDSYIYLKQLLKTSIKVGENIVRPYLVLAKLLTELDYLTFEEFTYLLPLATDSKSVNEIIGCIRAYRNAELSIEDIIYEKLIGMENYKIAFEMFNNNVLTEELICLVGMNRKSRNYDKPYYDLLKI